MKKKLSERMLSPDEHDRDRYTEAKTEFVNRIQYLQETTSIDYSNAVIQDQVKDLIKQSDSSLDYIRRAYEFVRDEIPHSWDIRSEVVSHKASEVLRNKTGICWTNGSASMPEETRKMCMRSLA